MDEAAHLSARLEAALLREVAEQYRHLALAYFKGALKLPQFELVTSRARLGRWIPDTRIIELSRPLVLEQPWGVVVEVLKHEMAHQYVAEVLGEHGESAHGPRFRAVCDEARHRRGRERHAGPDAGRRARRARQGRRAHRAAPRARGEPERPRGRGRDGRRAAPPAQAQHRAPEHARGPGLRVEAPRRADGPHDRGGARPVAHPRQALLRRGDLGARSTGPRSASAAASSRSAARPRTSRSPSTSTATSCRRPRASGWSTRSSKASSATAIGARSSPA